MMKTDEQFTNEVLDLVGTSYVFIEKYKGAHTKIQYYHVDCGKVHSITPSNFLHGQRCPEHRYDKISNVHKNKYNTPWFKKRIKQLTGDEYTSVTPYENAKTKVNIIHNKCGYKDWWVTPSDFLGGRRCPKCAKKIRIKKETKSLEEFKREVAVLGNGEYVVIGKYKNWKTPVKMKHLKCGKEFPMAPSSFLRGSRCRCTHHFIGEDLIKKILSELSINYTVHAKFDWLRYKKPQHLDFYLLDYQIGIEYDGEQHFDVSKEWYSEEIVKRDKNKDKLCKSHNIYLIRIPYKYHTYKRIKDVLIKKLIKAGVPINFN